MDNKIKHTIGKWKVAKSGHPHFKLCVVTEFDGGSVCHITNWTEANANAKLISKSTEMLEALKTIDRLKDAIKPTHEDFMAGRGDTSVYNLMNRIESLIKEIES